MGKKNKKIKASIKKNPNKKSTEVGANSSTEEIAVELSNQVYKTGFKKYKSIEKGLDLLENEGILEYKYLERIQTLWPLVVKMK